MELFDVASAKDVVVKEPTAEALARRMQAVLQQGAIRTIKLTEQVTSAKRLWLRWHGHHVARLPSYISVFPPHPPHVPPSLLNPE